MSRSISSKARKIDTQARFNAGRAQASIVRIRYKNNPEAFGVAVAGTEFIITTRLAVKSARTVRLASWAQPDKEVLAGVVFRFRRDGLVLIGAPKNPELVAAYEAFRKTLTGCTISGAFLEAVEKDDVQVLEPHSGEWEAMKARASYSPHLMIGTPEHWVLGPPLAGTPVFDQHGHLVALFPGRAKATDPRQAINLIQTQYLRALVDDEQDNVVSLDTVRPPGRTETGRVKASSKLKAVAQ